LDGWEGQQLAIAMDATNLGDRFVVLAISVVYLPVAWEILKAQKKNSGNRNGWHY
jgi:predicted phosphoribosyltransferase